MKPRQERRRIPRRGVPQRPVDGDMTALAADVAAHHETSPRLTGGDVDADWLGAWSAGEEAVGGSVATPDQSVVDELGEALGVAQAPDAEVVMSADILAERDRHRWDLEREASREEDGRRCRSVSHRWRRAS